MAKKTARPDGIRIQLKGLHSLQDIEAMIHEVFDRLRDRGVRHANGGNLYINISDDKGFPVIVEEYARNHIIMEAPYRSIADERGI
jgi:hypothetical protein